MKASLVGMMSGLMAAGAALPALAQELGADGRDHEFGSVTDVMDGINSFNDYWLVPIMFGIAAFVLVLMIFIMIRFREKANPVPSTTTHHTGLEIAWTIIPVFILAAMAVPSFKMLYFQDTIPKAELVVKATADTWNWEYSYPDYENIDPFVSNIVDIEMDEKQVDGKGLSHAEIIAKIEAREGDQPKLNGRPYLLATDAALVVPVDTTVEVQVTSNNNLHAFAVPEFGVKIDAVPGRINHTWFKVHAGKTGRYYGQCSEICGVRHAFMPIEVLVVSKADFQRWTDNNGSFTRQVTENQVGAQSTVLQ